MKRPHFITSSISYPKAHYFRKVAILFSFASLLASCDNLPSGGPRAGAYDSAGWKYESPTEGEAAETAKLPFVLVDVDRNVLETLASAEDSGYFKGALTDRSPPSSIPLGVGDVLRITIFEAGPGGLFVAQSGANSNGNFVTLPDQEVDPSGYISVPYAGKDGETGKVRVDGRSAGEVQHEIQQKLLNKAIEPQVIVTLVKRTSNMYSVIGDVNAAGRFSLEHGGVRVLDALSNAGGPRSSDYNTLITLQRGTSTATVRLSTIMGHSENNIFIQPNDLISVKKDERYYNVLGATNSNSRLVFESESVSVADALAKAGGLDGDNAEPSSVAVFRREDQKTLETAGVTLDGFKGTDMVPTVYRFDLTQPTGIFLAQRMQLRHNDVVYVSKHGFTDISKLLGAFRDILLINLIDK